MDSRLDIYYKKAKKRKRLIQTKEKNEKQAGNKIQKVRRGKS